MRSKVLILFVSALLSSVLSSHLVRAHCPLCTAGAAVAAGGAVWLGVSKVVVSLFIGAFAVSMGFWFSNVLKKQYIPFQRLIIILASFLLTVIPILPIISSLSPLYISLTGDYGSLLNRTYLLNLSLFGSIFGGLIVCSTPSISNKITKLRKGKIIPFQGVILTFILLLIIGAIIQLIIQ